MGRCLFGDGNIAKLAEINFVYEAGVICRSGHKTDAIATTINATAVQSCQCKISSNHIAPVKTPNTGMNITLKVDATGGNPRANVSQADSANANTPTAL